MRLRRPLPAVQGDTLHIVGVGDNRIGKVYRLILCVWLCVRLAVPGVEIGGVWVWG